MTFFFRTITRLGALTGGLLLLLNVAGLLFPNDHRKTLSSWKLTSYAEALQAIETQPTKPSLETVSKLNTIINEAMAHKWPSSITRVPARQNYLLWAAAWVDPYLDSLGLSSVETLFQQYQFSNPRKALRRGFGICSQIALTMSGFLHELGIANDTVTLGGHVVLQAHISEETTVLADPSKGVILPFGIDEATKHMEEIVAAYPPGSSIPSMYGPEGNIVIQGGIKNYFPKLSRLEHLTFIIIWIIPILLIIPYAAQKMRKS